MRSGNLLMTTKVGLLNWGDMALFGLVVVFLSFLLLCDKSPQT